MGFFRCYAPLVLLNRRPADSPRTRHHTPALFCATERWDFTGDETGILQEVQLIHHGGPDDPPGGSCCRLHQNINAAENCSPHLHLLQHKGADGRVGIGRSTQFFVEPTHEFSRIVDFIRECARVMMLLTVTWLHLLQ